MIENIPQEQLSPILPISNPPKIWVPFVAMLVVVALVSGGGVYLLATKHNQTITDNQLKQTGFTNNQVVSTVEPSISQPTILLTSPTPVDPRIELTADEWNKKFVIELNKGDNCSNFYKTRFSTKPNAYVTFTSSEFKYSINFPYNASWGDKENKVKPYDRNSYDNKSIVFGQPSFSEGCSFSQANLTELPRSTIDQEIQIIDAENIKQTKERVSFPETATYKKITNLRYSVLEIETANALFGSVKSYKVFLPTVTLEFTNPFPPLDEDLFIKLVDSIILLS